MQHHPTLFKSHDTRPIDCPNRVCAGCLTDIVSNGNSGMQQAHIHNPIMMMFFDIFSKKLDPWMSNLQAQIACKITLTPVG